MYFFDNDHHHKPHIHVEYQGQKAVVEIATGLIIAGALPSKQTKLVSAWVEIHADELLADWQLAVNGEPVFKIEPLR
jgi:desulfoferrodoxin (superoxide reductase-like protein)